MQRCKFGGLLLILLLIAGLLSTAAMTKIHSGISDSLKQAAQAAMTEDWQQALTLSQNARDVWEKKWRFSAVFADHEPMEDIDSLFAQLEVFGDARDPVSFAGVCAQLSRLTEAMGDAHALNWWSLL